MSFLLCFLPTLSLSQVAVEMSICLLFQEEALLNLMEKLGHIRLVKNTDKYPEIKTVYSTSPSKDLHVCTALKTQVHYKTKLFTEKHNRNSKTHKINVQLTELFRQTPS